MESMSQEYEEKEFLPEKTKINPPVKTKLLSVDAAELVTCDEDTSSVLCDTYIYDPDENEAKLGSLYLILETINHSNRSSQVLEAVATAIRKEYYRDPTRSMFDSLEGALGQANHVLSDYIDQGEVDWVDNFHACACAFQGQNIHISRVGDAELLLARKGRLTDIGEGLSDSNLRRPHHAFTSVASGSVAENDVLVLSTPQLAHLIPNDRLNHMITNKTPADTIGSLRSLLDDSREETAFALLVLQFSKLPERLPAPAVPLNMPKKVNLTPQPTVNTIRPRRPIPTKRTFWGNFFRIISQISMAIARFCRHKLFPAIGSSISWIIQKSGNIFSGIKKISKNINKKKESQDFYENNNESEQIDNFYENNNERENSEETIDQNYPSDDVDFSNHEETSTTKVGFSKRFIFPIFNFIRKIIGPLFSFKNAPKTTKILLIIIIIFIIIFIFGIRSLSQKKQADATLRGIAEKLEQARVKKDNADSALIYNNAEKARQDLQESLTLAEQVNKSGSYKNESEQLINDIQNIQDRIDKVIRLSNPNIIGNFANVAGNLKTPAMVAIEKYIYTFDPVTNAIFSLNVETKETKTVSQTSQGVGYFSSVTPLFAEKSILFTTDTPGLAMFDTTHNELTKQEIKFPEGIKKIDSVSTFGSRMYVLSLADKMIYGFSKTLAGYDGGNAWLSDKNVPVDRATSMGIDGYIYLLLDDGKIIKMLKGKPVDFNQETISTPIVKPSRLLIYEDIKHLFVLDQAQKRVLIYDTVGNLINQYVFPNAKALRDIAISSKEEVLYVLDETSVYSVQLKKPAVTPSPNPAN